MPRKWLKKDANEHIKSIYGDKLALDVWAEKEFGIKLNRSYKFDNMLVEFWKSPRAPKEVVVVKEKKVEKKKVKSVEGEKYRLLRENPKLRIT